MSHTRYCFIWDIETVLGFLYSLDSEKIELKILTYKKAILLALTRPSRVHEIVYLDICYLIKYSRDYTKGILINLQKQQGKIFYYHQ